MSPVAVAGSSDRLTSYTRDGVTYTVAHNGNGDITSMQGTGLDRTMNWSAHGRLNSVTTNGVYTGYMYDALNRRIRETRSEGGVKQYDREYIYAGQDAQGVHDLVTGSEGYFIRSLGLDEPLAWIDGAGNVMCLHADALGSVGTVTDADGDVVIEHTYSPYGEMHEIVRDGTAFTDTPPVGFAGRPHDELNKTINMRNRYYSYELRRFISEDPLGVEAGLNFYAYVGGDPVNFTDPWGLFEATINDYGGRFGPTYGGTMNIVGNNDKSVTVPVSTWPNPNNPSPGISPGTYDSVYRDTGHRGVEAGIRLEDGGKIPTRGPNPNQDWKSFADGINIHCGNSSTNRGSAGCITIKPDHCQEVWNILMNGERGTISIYDEGGIGR